MIIFSFLDVRRPVLLFHTRVGSFGWSSFVLVGVGGCPLPAAWWSVHATHTTGNVMKSLRLDVVKRKHLLLHAELGGNDVLNGSVWEPHLQVGVCGDGLVGTVGWLVRSFVRRLVG